MIQRKGFFDSMTAKIIIVNIVAFLLILILEGFLGTDFVREYIALQPVSIMGGQKLWTLFTSMFAHEAIWHIFANMFSLYFLGTTVEKLIGKKRFVAFYVLSGLFAGVFWSVLSVYATFNNSYLISLIGHPTLYGIGASGAIFGLLGILSILTPRSQIYFLAGPLIAILGSALLQNMGLPSQLSLILDFAVIAYMIYSVYLMMTFDPKGMKLLVPVRTSMAMIPIIAIVPLAIISLFFPLPIGNMAHLGGLLVGLGYAYYLVKKYPKKSKMIASMFR